jgi:putative aldouronate transport system substrate-binding protein
MNLNDVEALYPQHLLQPLNSVIAKSSIFSDKSIISPKRSNEVTLPDGKIYGIWTATEGGRLLTFREDWLKALHLSNPTTLAQYTNVYNLFKQHYHAYGLDLAGIYDIQPFMSAAGVRDGYLQVNGKWTIPYATSAAIPVYTWLHGLYAQGLLDPSFVTDSTAQERAKLLTGRVGSYVYWDAWVGLLNNLARTTDHNPSFDVEGAAPPVGPQGQRYLSSGEPALWTLPVTTHNTSEAIKFMEYWLTPAGRLLGSLGLPGVDYTVTNGQYQLTATGKSENMDHGTPFPLGTWKNPAGYLPGFLQARAMIDKYGSLPVTRTTTNAATTVEQDYIVKAILGQISPAQAVSQMHQALLSQQLIDQ